MNKQQTAVEWLNDKILELDVEFDITLISRTNYWIKRKEILEQAKEMEKQQIINTWYNGYINQSPMIDEENCAEQYYNETFKK